MRIKNIPYNIRSLICLFLGVPVVLGITWILERMIGVEFPGWLGVGLNLFSFVMTLIGFLYAIRAVWEDMLYRHKYVLLISRVSFFSLLGLVGNGFWVLLYVVLIGPYLLPT